MRTGKRTLSLTARVATLALPLAALLTQQPSFAAEAYSRVEAAAPLNAAQVASQDELAKEQWAHALGIKAYIFGLPLKVYERERSLRLNPKKLERVKHLCPCAPINHVGHMSKLATADDILPYTPNNDTVYSGAALELADEPVIVSFPDIMDRYWSVQITNAYLENQMYIGTRATGGKGGHHAFVGPNWKGDLPEDVIVHRMKSDSVLVAVRIAQLPENPADLEKVKSLQHQIVSTSLSYWGKPGGFGKAKVPDMKRKRYSGELAFYEQFADLLAERPPSADHAAALNDFKFIGIELGKPFDASRLDAATRRGMVRALADAKNIMRWKVKYRGTAYDTRWNNLHEGSYGYNYMNRAEGALEGLIVHDREEAVYFSTYEDGKGQLLDATRAYKLHFEKDEVARLQKNGFWSLTMYGPDFQLVSNPINRFAIGDRTPGLQYGEDGSLDIYIQNTPPRNQSGNWLPTPKEGLFRINYRIYLPAEEASNPKTLIKFLPGIEAAE